MKLLRKLQSDEFFELLCMLQLGIGNTCLWTGFDTHGFILESVLHSVHERNPNQIDGYAGYNGQAADYAAFTIANFLSPVLIHYFDPKWSIFIGSIPFTMYQLGFLFLNSYYFYISSALMGIGFSMFYTGYGCYLTDHSTRKNMARNSSLTWGIGCLSMSVGGIVLLISFENSDAGDISNDYRQFSDRQIRVIFGIFAIFSLLANIIYFLLSRRKPKHSLSDEISRKNDQKSFTNSLTLTLKTFLMRDVWRLALLWIFIGVYTGFLLGTYPTTLTFTASLSKSNLLVPLYALAVGTGEISTGIFVTYLSRKFNGFGGIPSATIGFLVHIVAFILILLSVPRYSTLRPNKDDPLLIKPNYIVSFLIGYLLGMGDCWWNTAKSCIIPILLPESRAEGFAVSRIFQSLASCLLFYLSTKIDVYEHFGILMVTALLAFSSFIFAARRGTKKLKLICHNTVAPLQENSLKM